jgi:hypothetical protein
LLTSDIDERDHKFLTGERTPEGFFCVRAGLDQAIARARSYAQYADLVWCETKTPDLDEARRFAEAVRKEFPNKLLAYNCSFALIQLETETRQRDNREVPARACGDGLQISIRYPGRLSHAQLFNVQLGARLRETRNGSLF